MFAALQINKREKTNFIILTSSAAFASLEKGKTALNLCPAFAIWLNAAIETTAVCFTAPKRLLGAMIAAISMLQNYKAAVYGFDERQTL